MSVVAGKSIFARVQTPGQFGAYFIDLAVNKATAKDLRELGLKVRPANKELPDGTSESEYGEFICHFKENQKPKVVDAKLKETDVLIGNGSDVEVQFNAGTWNFKGKTGVTGYLKAVKINNLVPYERAPDKLEFEGAEDAEFEGEDDLEFN